MAKSKCFNCDGTSFELVENIPTFSKFKYMFVQCSKCGNILGVLDFYNTGYSLNQLNEKVDKLNSQLEKDIFNGLNIINKNILTLIKSIKS